MLVLFRRRALVSRVERNRGLGARVRRITWDPPNPPFAKSAKEA
jgi:hypothetical protein